MPTAPQFPPRAASQPARRKPDLDGVRELHAWPAQDLNACAEAMGRLLRPIAVSQVRKFLGAVSRIAVELQAGDEGEAADGLRDRVLLLKPRLAYVAARANPEPQPPTVRALFEDVSEMVERVFTPPDFRRLHDYLQGVVAYQRFRGGHE